MNVEVDFDKVGDFLKQHKNILFALGFGSAAKKEMNKLSDVDIGIYTVDEMPLLEIGKIVVGLEKIVKKKVDLVFPDNPVEPDAGDEEVDYSGIEMDVQRIHRAVEKLPDGYRVIFSLYALEGYDHGEISQIMNISESTSKSQYLRAKQKIKEILKQP